MIIVTTSVDVILTVAFYFALPQLLFMFLTIGGLPLIIFLPFHFILYLDSTVFMYAGVSINFLPFELPYIIIDIIKNILITLIIIGGDIFLYILAAAFLTILIYSIIFYKQNIYATSLKYLPLAFVLQYILISMMVEIVLYYFLIFTHLHMRHLAFFFTI